MTDDDIVRLAHVRVSQYQSWWHSTPELLQRLIKEIEAARVVVEAQRVALNRHHAGRSTCEFCREDDDE